MENLPMQSLESLSISSQNPFDPDEFRRQGHMMIDFLADYYKNVESYPVRSQVEPGYLGERLPESAPNNSESVETILQDVTNDIIPGLTHWQTPNYFASLESFPSGGSISRFLDELLSTGLNIVGFNSMSTPAATELENIVMNWVGQMLTLPRSFLFSSSGSSLGGVLQGTTEAILYTLTAARDKMLKEIGRKNIDKLVVYASDQSDTAVQIAARIAGIKPKNFRAIGTSKATNFSLSPSSLQSTIVADVEFGLVPLFLCATVGTTSTMAVDPISALCEVAKMFGIWVHVDAAYAGIACICPEFRHFIDGVEEADSFSLNAHKWFFTSLDCSCVWVKNSDSLLKALSTNQGNDSMDWQIALSRRFQAMKLWLVLRRYGIANLRSFLRSHARMANDFQELIDTDTRFEVVVPRTFAMVCFRLKPSALFSEKTIESDYIEAQTNEINAKLLESVNASGHIYMSHAVVGRVYMIRFTVGETPTEERHVTEAWKLVQENTNTILTG